MRPPRPASTALHIPAGVWEALKSQMRSSETGLRKDRHAILVGTRDTDTITIALAVTDDENSEDRATKRRLTATNDHDVVGQATLTYENLDLTIARTTQEQMDRRQDQYSAPEGHVFLHLHHIGGDIAACAHIVKNHKLTPALLRIKDDGQPAPKRGRRGRRKRTSDEPSAPTSDDRAS